MAILLALVAVSVATLLGLSVAANRDATVATSSNLARVSASRAAAASGLDLAASMLAREDGLGSIRDGILFEGVELNGAVLRAEVTDLETGRAADGSTRAYEVVIRSDRDGLIERARAVGRMPAHDAPMRADLDCSEFGALATGTLAVEGDAHVGLWSKSPLSALSEPVRIGSASGRGTAVRLGPDASVHGCVQLALGAFQEDPDDAAEALADHRFTIPSEIHVPNAPAPATSRRLTTVPSLMLDGLVGSSVACSGDARVPARGAATVRGNITVDIAGNLFVERGSRLFVEDALVVVVRGNTVVDAGSVEVGPEGSLTLIALGDLTLSAAYIGGARSDPSEGRDATGGAAYDGGATRTVLFASGSRRVLVADGSVVKGQIYAPAARLDIESRSAVYGRVLGAEVTLHAGVGLFYDPSLDNRLGWTNPDSGIWGEDGSPRREIVEVPVLADEAMLELASLTNIEPDAPSAAEAAVLLSGEAPLARTYNARIELDANDSDRESRSARRAKLLERVEELRRIWRERLSDSNRSSDFGFIKIGFFAGGNDD